MNTLDTIVLFSRCELTDLYGSLSPHLSKYFKVIHLAYSPKEAQLLQDKYQISNVTIFTEHVAEIIEHSSLDSILIEEIDQLIINQSSGRFCLNSAIQSDRGFSHLNYSETLILSQAYYLFWSKFIAKYEVKLIFHEPTSLFLNHIAALICKQVNSHYLCQIMVTSDKKYSFLFIADDNANALELNHEHARLSNDDIEKDAARITNFLSKFRETEEIFLSSIIQVKIPYFRIVLSTFKYFYSRLFKLSKYHRIKDNIDYWLSRSDHSWNRLNNLITYKLKLKYDQFDPGLNYYYYPFHLEPEAVVLYWGQGLYKGQIKLIENIAAQLPPNTFLYVKDHPHYIGYRNVQDYLKLKKVPNIRILAPELPGKSIIKNSIGVITINGTAGFEGILFNKPVYTFGNAFYDVSNRVYRVNHIKELRPILYQHRNMVLHDDVELSRFVLAFLNSCHDGVVDYFVNRIYKYPIDLEQNTQLIANSIYHLYSQFEKHTNS